jgi:hypothetical protein
VDLCLEDRIAVESLEGASLRPYQRAKQKEGINVLSFITLHNFLEQESIGWIACMFLVFCHLIAFDSAHRFRQVRLTPCSRKSCSTTTSYMI